MQYEEFLHATPRDRLIAALQSTSATLSAMSLVPLNREEVEAIQAEAEAAASFKVIFTERAYQDFAQAGVSPKDLAKRLSEVAKDVATVSDLFGEADSILRSVKVGEQTIIFALHGTAPSPELIVVAAIDNSEVPKEAPGGFKSLDIAHAISALISSLAKLG